MSYYPEPDNHIRDKAKVILNSPNFANRKELENTTGVDKKDYSPKKDFVALKAEVDKLDINQLINVLILVSKLV